MKRKKIFWKVYPYLFFIIIGSLLTVAFLAIDKINSIYLEEISTTLESRAKLIAVQIPKNSVDIHVIDSLAEYLGDLTETRVTIIDVSGKVYGDSEKDPRTMENHGSRPEISEALNGRIGQSIRYSSTVNTKMMYIAIPVSESSHPIYIIRTSYPMTKIQSTIEAFSKDLIIGGISITLLATLLTLLLFRRISNPLRELKNSAERFSKGDFTTKAPILESEEIGALAETMNQMVGQLEGRIATIMQQRNEREAILSSLAEGVVALDANEKIVSLNRKAIELLELDTTNIIGKSIQEVIRNDKLHNYIEKSVHSSQSIDSELHIEISRDKYLSVYGTHLKDREQNQVGTVIVLNDITKIKKLDIMRRDFIANVSHELRTPITAIRGSVETLLDGALDEKDSALKFTEIISRHSKRLISIVEDLLSLAKFENEDVFRYMNFKNEKIYPIINSAILACEQKSITKNIKIEVHCPEDLSVDCQQEYLEHALINLLDNAIKYTEPDTTVVIDIKEIMGQLQIAITDSGCGIAEQHLPRLFERFYRVDMARSRDMGGTGLGLAIVKHIARIHNGTVIVDSEVGKGSTFSIQIPLIQS